MKSQFNRLKGTTTRRRSPAPDDEPPKVANGELRGGRPSEPTNRIVSQGSIGRWVLQLYCTVAIGQPVSLRYLLALMGQGNGEKCTLLRQKKLTHPSSGYPLCFRSSRIPMTSKGRRNLPFVRRSINITVMSLRECRLGRRYLIIDAIL